jgi:hypothetical protein
MVLPVITEEATPLTQSLRWERNGRKKPRLQIRYGLAWLPFPHLDAQPEYVGPWL